MLMRLSLVTLLASPLVCAHADDRRAAIEGVITAMNTAVLAGEGAAYLSCIDMRDPEFAMEQRHWADDLARHTPHEFELSIVDDAARVDDDPVITDERAVVGMRMRYRMPAGHADTERGKRATWTGVFVNLDADGAGPEPSRWLYAGEEWTEIGGTYGDAAAGTSGSFVVKFQKGSERVAQQVIEAFPGAKAHADEGFEITLTRPLQIKLYQSMEHLKAWVYLSMPDEILGGWNEPGESIKFMASYTSGVDKWRAAFAHEYGHVATWELGPKVKAMPWWMAEGAAELSAEQFAGNREYVHRMMLRKAENGTLCAWEEIADYDKAEQRVKRMAYHQGQAIMGYVSDRWGRKARNQWLKGVASGETLDDATKNAFGVTFHELDRQWRASLKDVSEDAAKTRTPSGGD